jgi:hypothetical protein
LAQIGFEQRQNELVVIDHENGLGMLRHAEILSADGDPAAPRVRDSRVRTQILCAPSPDYSRSAVNNPG